MSSTFQVLCLNGRRQTVKLTPNAKLLQILEEVCIKQGCEPLEDYALKHGHKIIDLTQVVRYSGLPNHAKLELVKTEQKRVESDVTVALQLPNNERQLHEFPPSTTLSEILAHWKTETQCEEGKQRVCIYMREEIIGEMAINDMTLRKLGLLGGRCLLRLVHREVNGDTLKSIEEKLVKDKNKLEKMMANASKASHRPMDDSKAAASIEVQNSSNVVASTGVEQPMDIEEAEPSTGRVSMEASVDNSEKCVRPKEHTATQPEKQKNETLANSKIQQMASAIIPHASKEQIQQMVQAFRSEVSDGSGRRKKQKPIKSPEPREFKFPEETKGQHLYHNELSKVNHVEFKPCDREVVIYSLDEVQKMTSSNEDEPLPDKFFEVTEADIRSRLRDLQTKAKSEEMLMTSEMRRAQKESEMDKYPRVIIRVHFPERLMLQGVFNVRESVYALQKFVQENLEDKKQDFYLYTTPPKSMLKDKYLNLFEANLAPMCVVYFGVSKPQDHSLSCKTLSTLHDADEIVNKYMSSSGGESSSSGIVDMLKMEQKALKQNEATSKRPTAPQASTSSGSAKVPKWFTQGKK